jgi:hypothetical protein
MLEAFLIKHDIDIALLQEVTSTHVNTVHQYNVLINQGTEGWGTAILTKQGLTVNNVNRIPSGRGIAVDTIGTRFINV